LKRFQIESSVTKLVKIGGEIRSIFVEARAISFDLIVKPNSNYAVVELRLMKH